jgi:hypothetical protein
MQHRESTFVAPRDTYNSKCEVTVRDHHLSPSHAMVHSYFRPPLEQWEMLDYNPT